MTKERQQWRRWTFFLPLGVLFLGLLLTWSSPLLFAPVPWPDDSAYWIAGRDFWTEFPPRLIMRSLQPFVPSYGEASFNTMPMLPILVGLGDLTGIRGSFAIKLWPNLGWLLSGASLLWLLHRSSRLPLLSVTGIALLFASHPALRWSSQLLRPEPLIGFLGVLLIGGLSFGKWNTTRLTRWGGDPISIILAVAAYLHFNAIHLVPSVVVALIFRAPQRLIRIALETFLLLAPWGLWALVHLDAFQAQMKIQFERLSAINPWLDSMQGWTRGLFQDMGNPVPYPEVLFSASIPLWGYIVGAFGVAMSVLSVRALERLRSQPQVVSHQEKVDLLPVATWVISALMLWHFKAEVWFTHYLHLSLVCWIALIVAKTVEAQKRRSWFQLQNGLIWGMAVLFSGVSLWLAQEMDRHQTWTRQNFSEWTACVERTLVAIENEKRAQGATAPLSVWAPTFPDVLVELSLLHPDWTLTRTNDFHSAIPLALQHARQVDAVVITESYSTQSQWREGSLDAYPDAQSVWLNWKGYYYSRLNQDPQFKSQRRLCQAGRLQAFILSD
jgi:hypothetical protein